jgi:outer membrane protein OmpA-like peptidoglycan-associated protein
MRRAIVGLAAAACFVGVIGGLTYLMSAALQKDGQDWRQGRLAFLKSTYDQIQADIAAGGSAVPSEQREAESVRQDMAATAKPMPAESVPSDIRALLSASHPPKKDHEAALIGPVGMERSLKITAEQAALAQPVSDRPVAHPSDVSIELRKIGVHRDSIILSATIANLRDRAIRLNRARSFVLVDPLNDVYHLNPPVENAEVEVPSHTELNGDLVFIGPIAPSVQHLTLSTNKGISAPDNPDDSEPALKAEIPVNDGSDSVDEQANDPGGVALRVGQILGGPDTCGVPLLATNGTERTIALSENINITLTDEHGASAQVEPPPENRQLIVPAGSRLGAELVFGCRQLDLASGLTLTTNQDDTATHHKADDSRPVLKVRVASDRKGNGSTVAGSRASIALIARSQFVASPTGVPAVLPPDDGSTATPQTAVALASAASETSREASLGRTAPEASSSSEQPEPPLATPDPSRTLPELETALHAEKTDRGLRVILPVDLLFGATDGALDPAADPPLWDLAGLIKAMEPREIVIGVHSDASTENAANLALSKKRAHAVVAWLVAHGLEHEPHFVERGYGSIGSIKPNINGGSDNTGAEQSHLIEVLLRRN